MAKRGYKLQEFVAHSANVNCLSIGKKSCRLLITGGDDHNVNLWAIGKPSSLMSLCGHISPVESLAFDSAEVLVLAGASAGVIKLWDLEEAKMVRTLAGHRSSCTAVQFHPFGEFFASGSMDTNLRIWDIRKKGCIHTYKGHTRGISTIRFTPDGRWVVSGGFDNVVKVWDLTAGKLLHDFKFHEGQIRSIDFHPLEFLLATGSADRTVKFWDLETFELIGSSRPETTGVCSIIFHPDGRTIFSGLEDSLKVYSWEPVICHDAVDMGWSTLSDLCINDGKLLGCSFYENSVGVWVADVSHIEPYGSGVPDQNDYTEKKINPLGTHSLGKVGTGIRSTSSLCCRSPDYDTKEIKTIYVDTTGGKPMASLKVGSLESPKIVLPVDSKEITDLQAEKQNTAKDSLEKFNVQALIKSSVVPSIVPSESPAGKDSANSGKESITFSKTKPGMLLRPAHVRRPSVNKVETEKLSTPVESGSFSSMNGDMDCAKDPNFQTRLLSSDGALKSVEKDSDIKSSTEKIQKVVSLQGHLNQENFAVVRGRTRSLVERFERREGFNTNDDQAANITPQRTVISNEDQATIITPSLRLSNNEDQAPKVTPEMRIDSNTDQTTSTITHVRFQNDEGQTTKTTSPVRFKNSEDQFTTSPPVGFNDSEDLTTNATSPAGFRNSEDRTTNTSPLGSFMNREDQMTNTTSSGRFVSCEDQMTNSTPPGRSKNSEDQVASATPGRFKNSLNQVASTTPPVRFKKSENQAANTTLSVRFKKSEDKPTKAIPRMRFKNNGDQPTNTTPYMRFKNNEEKAANMSPNMRYRNNGEQATILSSHLMVEADKRPTNLNREPQIPGRDTTPANDGEVIENLMHTHDVFISTLRSRLTKLQVIRHFWERNDIKGAIGAMMKLPDHSVQADIISILMEKMETLNLDLFLCLLPVLVGLLDSKMERHANISLEMLLKLVAVFGPMIRATVSAPPAVGVDLHLEQRRECCKQCFVHLQKVQKILPDLVRRGGLLAKSATELNLVLQES
ncbi:katanin p80 WD40 repeat-containing subunit B1 homolog KTN80.2-like isoform X2 [Mangifera indica]|uniref:katanin p80 WD40 repeat-containing subunit B1 homolog KTN80.2-like isoform X2 n=1 Tax=Mangifera indica TaxID=29780 RepID=UPI001CFA3380|nr:katanin p80 WD40 repeat-containing subunit B1 homolog KTN80.2-like isoform X2 [Mangifera indica]